MNRNSQLSAKGPCCDICLLEAASKLAKGAIIEFPLNLVPSETDTLRKNWIEFALRASHLCAELVRWWALATCRARTTSRKVRSATTNHNWQLMSAVQQRKQLAVGRLPSGKAQTWKLCCECLQYQFMTAPVSGHQLLSPPTRAPLGPCIIQLLGSLEQPPPSAVL